MPSETSPSLRIIEVGPVHLPEYASISATVLITSIFILDLQDGGLGGVRFHEEAVVPYIKDYDQDGGSPVTWTQQFFINNWGLFLAVQDDQPVGAAAVAWNTNGTNMLEGRRELAVLWDIRVDPRHRREGIGAALFRHAANWARARGCTRLKIETQNINVPACRFYRRMGCELGTIHRHAYVPPLDHEVQLNWYLDLTAERQ
ncbi:MAG: GNAT family N-acetyltransferase [Anaerolineales bacterium]